jgi:long-chain acyl-CoA synthetase
MNATIVPMYEAQLPADWTYILNDSESSVVFCATEDIFDRVQKEVLPSTPFVNAALCLDAPAGVPYAFATAMAEAKESMSQDEYAPKVIAPTPDDLANLIYTSGTTGKPKVRVADYESDKRVLFFVRIIMFTTTSLVHRS